MHALTAKLVDTYRFAGLTKNEMSSGGVVSATSTVWLYRYDKKPGTWLKVAPYVETPSNDIDSAYHHSSSLNYGVVPVDPDLPRARCAHQVVYDPATKTVYLHGGNAGVASPATRSRSPGGSSGESRLDDFWSMTFKR